MTEIRNNSISDEEGLPESAVNRVEVSFAGKIWNVVSKTFAFQGEELTREYIAHPGAVAVLAINDQDEVLLIKQYRAPVNQYLYEMPAGLRDAIDANDIEAAQRELAEEADYKADKWTHLHSFYTTPGSSSEVIEIFLAEDLSHTGSTFERTSEEKGMIPIWVPFNEVLHAVMQSKTKSPTLVVAVLALAARRNSENNG
jgi:8-oxo-dGTP pyrophosphatase MutT (NUDIX family)